MITDTLAKELGDGTLQLPSFVRDLSTSEDWSKEKALASSAVSAYRPQEVREAQEFDSVDAGADVVNDRAYLRAVIKFEDPQSPFSVINASTVA